jgi:hypothetical protein
MTIELSSQPAIDVAPPQSWKDAVDRFTALLDAERAIPEAVLHRAMLDSVFAHRLLISRRSPKFLDALINDPDNARYLPEPLPQDRETAEPAPQSNLALLAKAGKALARWGMTGFAHVDAEVFERRLSACEACPNLVAPPDLAVYRMTANTERKKTVCSKCGCVVRNKARMSTESCPAVHPDKPDRTRWDEPIARPAERTE